MDERGRIVPVGVSGELCTRGNLSCFALVFLCLSSYFQLSIVHIENKGLKGETIFG